MSLGLMGAGPKALRRLFVQLRTSILTGAVAQAIGNDEGDVRSGQQRERNAGGDEGEINLQGHGGTQLRE